jgi:hypothetical protein
MRSNIFKMVVSFSAMLLVLAAVDTASAQRREVRGRNLSKSQVKAIVNRVETRLDNFVKAYDKALDRSRLNGTSREDWLNRRASDLEKATDELRREFDRRDVWAENKDEVRRCLSIASDIDHNMRSYDFGSATESNWARVVYELNSLADVYNLPRVRAIAYN